MYTRVLVPLDGSTVALQVLPYATLVAKATGAKVELLSAISAYPKELIRRVSHEYMEGGPLYPPSIQQWTSLQDKVHQDASNTLNEAAKPLRDAGFEVETTVAESDTVDAILNAADRDPDTLIAISTHGRSGVGRWMLGSITDKVVRMTKHATLVVRARDGQLTSAAPQFKRLILPLDGSEMSEAAVPHAITMAKALGLGVTLLRTVSPMSYGDTFADYVPAMYDNLMAEIDTDVKDYLAHQADCLREQGVEDVTVHAVDGYAGTAILDEVTEAGDRLVVMATHGRSGLGRWVLGSVADRVVRHSQGPVLIVRPPNHD